MNDKMMDKYVELTKNYNFYHSVSEEGTVTADVAKNDTGEKKCPEGQHYCTKDNKCKDDVKEDLNEGSQSSEELWKGVTDDLYLIAMNLKTIVARDDLGYDVSQSYIKKFEKELSKVQKLLKKHKK